MHTTKNKKSLLLRARRIQGQVQALIQALEREEDCGMILQQLAAVRGALHGLTMTVLEGHVTEHLHSPSAAVRRQAAEEILSLLRTYGK